MVFTYWCVFSNGRHRVFFPGWAASLYFLEMLSQALSVCCAVFRAQGIGWCSAAHQRSSGCTRTFKIGEVGWKTLRPAAQAGWQTDHFSDKTLVHNLVLKQ